MTRIREIYLLDPACLPPETIAVAFAKTSRSPESFKQIAAELSDENSANFHQKWVVGYGHSSVAEHAVLHIALENISRLAVETVNPAGWHPILKNPLDTRFGIQISFLFLQNLMVSLRENNI